MKSWKWIVGALVLLAVCDGNDGPDRHCYDFGNEKTLCFKAPLPADKYCYAGKDDTVRCYDQPL